MHRVAALQPAIIRQIVPTIVTIMIHQITIKTHPAMTHHTRILHENPLMTT